MILEVGLESASAGQIRAAAAFALIRFIAFSRAVFGVAGQLAQRG